MSEAADIADTRQGRILQELADLGMAVARDLSRRALAAESNDEAVALARALHQVARTVRQTLALEPRLAREHVEGRLALEAEAARVRAARVEQKKTRLKIAVERLIWTEAEGDDAEWLVDNLDDFIAMAAKDEGFLDQPFEAVIEKLRGDLGLAATVIYTFDGKTAPASAPGEAATGGSDSS